MALQQKISIKNKRAEFDYEIIERFSAGIALKGSEIKALRDGGGSINEAFCFMRDNELFIKNMNIPEYSHGGYTNHEVLRLRKLLLTKRELRRIDAKIRERGFAIIPIRLFMSDRGFAKIEIGLGRGKKTFDKRNTLKSKDSKREIDRVMKKYR
jgi:SsrA-binding protein